VEIEITLMNSDIFLKMNNEAIFYARNAEKGGSRVQRPVNSFSGQMAVIGR